MYFKALRIVQGRLTNTARRLLEIDNLIDKWLIHKGVEDPCTTDGDFKSKTGDGTGQFARRSVETKIGASREVELIETAHTGAIFTTTVQIAQMGNTVSVFASLAATPGASVVAPVKVDPRCPWVIRALIEDFSDWRFGGQDVPVGRAFDATTSSGVKDLCNALYSSSRKLPLVVVSVDKDERIWADLHTRAAEQLIGLADVAYVDAESSWQLTDELGTQDSCYLGAVRLYWPLLRSDGSYESIVWLAARLASFGAGDFGRNRFLSVLRRTVMSTAALTMVQPSSFREIHNAATKERLQALHGAAQDQELDSIVEENARLSAELEEAKQTIANLQWKVTAAAYAHRYDTTANGEGVDEPFADNANRKPPQPGDIRYYKKIGSGGGVDTLVETHPCQHKSSSWRPAFKGDQAEKGLLKLEGRDDWQSIAHCSACTGGGRWRVRW
ncbi:hypothetical protein [Ralstonia pseudosolanacearum]|uniref:Hypothetical tonb box, n-terminal protein n=1 Tax=Ralstonia nicotianae (strain ATCC BAA-1114 / GMI1000) TaxID=267608 RepID=Q8XUR2_RALN1|nr:hypothetical protein [Ralstonia pseudosolanacearum]MCQ4682400.1 hypothetical protein [Ralstonia pseudosolanacearum]CAD16833.1 hypothetical tonb box, n-terminal; protein [Ralstonia pseudosolanacearum GMI1000]